MSKKLLAGLLLGILALGGAAYVAADDLIAKVSNCCGACESKDK